MGNEALSTTGHSQAPAQQPAVDETVDTLRDALIRKITYEAGKDPTTASEWDWFIAAASVTRDRIVDRWLPSTRLNATQGRKHVYYLSLEFLIGRLLFDSLSNLGLVETM